MDLDCFGFYPFSGTSRGGLQQGTCHHLFCLRHHRHRGAALHGQQPAAFRCTRVLSCSAYKLVAPQSPHKEDLNWQRSHHYAELPRNHWVQLVVGRRASKPGLLKTAGAAVERNRTREPHSLMTRKRRPRGPPPKRPRCVCCSAPPWKVFTILLPPLTHLCRVLSTGVRAGAVQPHPPPRPGAARAAALRLPRRPEGVRRVHRVPRTGSDFFCRR